jgi:CBS domain-containing protein
MKVSEIMTPNVEVITPDASLRDAAQRMKALDVGMLPVCDGERLLGAVTDRDIVVRAAAEGKDVSQTRVSDIMTRQVHYVFEDQDADEAAQVMEDQQVRRVPVLDRNKRLVGIVSLGDVAVRTGDDAMSGDALEAVSEPARGRASAR